MINYIPDRTVTVCFVFKINPSFSHSFLYKDRKYEGFDEFIYVRDKVYENIFSCQVKLKGTRCAFSVVYFTDKVEISFGAGSYSQIELFLFICNSLIKGFLDSSKFKKESFSYNIYRKYDLVFDCPETTYDSYLNDVAQYSEFFSCFVNQLKSASKFKVKAHTDINKPISDIAGIKVCSDICLSVISSVDSKDNNVLSAVISNSSEVDDQESFFKVLPFVDGILCCYTQMIFCDVLSEFSDILMVK